MLDRPLVAFDIETIPDPDIGRRMLGLAGSDAEVVHEMVRVRLEETEGNSEYPQLPWHRIVSICATTLDSESGKVSIRALGGEAMDERSHIDGFFHLVSDELESPRLVSWNGSGFDLPVIRYRSMMLGITAPDFYRADGDRRWNSYQNRYHDLHTDVMDVLSGYGASMRIGLGTLGKVLGLPGKAFLDRAIYDHVLDGEGPRVTEYCKLDTVETLLIFLVWAFHAGQLSQRDLCRYVDAVCEAIGTLPYPGWRAIEVGLEGWPAWASSRRPPTRAPQLPSAVSGSSACASPLVHPPGEPGTEGKPLDGRQQQ
ncbi:MAG: 3'-5' exonuclease [Myxococcales bacterium]|nr:3'-5' exonuclease [Myxococcales bacterium]